jgi:hypothetical protein
MNLYIHYKPCDLIGPIVIDNARIYLSAAPRTANSRGERAARTGEKKKLIVGLLSV